MTPKRSATLTRDEILAAALKIIDAEGTDRLTMRRLASDLGVEAMSLYHHFPNKEAILEGVIQLALLGEVMEVQPSDDWRDPVVAAVIAFRRALVAHPNVLPIMVAHPPTTPGTSVLVEGPLRYLSEQGFSDASASDVFQAVFALGFGHAMLSTSYPTIQIEGAPQVAFTEESFARTLGIVLDGYGAGRDEPAPAE